MVSETGTVADGRESFTLHVESAHEETVSMAVRARSASAITAWVSSLLEASMAFRQR